MKKVILPCLAFIAGTLMLSGCATGTHIVTGDRHPPIPVEAVQLYQTPPEHYEVIGSVNSNARGARQRRMNAAIRQLRKQAATIGANGIILAPVETAGLAGRRIRLSGQAIYVP